MILAVDARASSLRRASPASASGKCSLPSSQSPPESAAGSAVWRPGFGHATRSFGHNSQPLESAWLSKSADSRQPFRRYEKCLRIRVAMSNRREAEMLKDAMKLEGWVAVVSLLLVLLLAELG